MKTNTCNDDFRVCEKLENISSISSMGSLMSTINSIGRCIMYAGLTLLLFFTFTKSSTAQSFTDHIIGSGLERADNRGTDVIGILDYNDDGYEDLIIEIPGNTGLLFKNNGNGTFSDVSNESNFPDCNIWSSNWAFLSCFDIDNNGFPDIVIYPNNYLAPAGDSLMIFMNYDGMFTEKTSEFGITNPITNWVGLNIVPFDYDNDGDLDILYTKADVINTTCDNGGVCVLVNNVNSLQPSFNESVELISYAYNVFPFGINVTDYNNNQKGDIVVCEQNGVQGGYGIHTFSLYNNNGNSTFSKVNSTNLSNASGQNFITVWDFDNDGLLDFLNGTDDCCGPMKNTVWKNNGDGTFTDMSSTINSYSGSNYYSTITAVDFNNDGNVDISMNLLYFSFKLWENSAGTFSENSAAYGLNIGSSNHYHSEWFDYNNDGALDLLFLAYTTAVPNPTISSLMQNPNSANNKFLRIKLVGTESPRDGHGAKVIVRMGTKKQTQYFNQNIGMNLSNIFHFGLGQSSQADSVLVFWPSGRISRLANVLSNQILTITEPTWKLQLVASAGFTVDNNNYLGIAENATLGLDPIDDMPEPPEPAGNYIQVYFPHPEYSQPLGNNYSQDFRAEQALEDSFIRWQFDVKTNQSYTDVSLNFISDGYIPTGFGMLLKDLTLGIQKNLKKDGMDYTYNSGSEEIHHFEIMIGDSTSPVVSLIKPVGGEIIRANNPYNVSWSMGDGSGIDSVLVYSSMNVGTTYDLIATLSIPDSSFLWTVSPTYLNHNCRIKVVVIDSMSYTARDSSDHTFTIVGDSLTATFTTGWNLIGTPLKANDSTISAIFSDDINESFYVYVYQPTTGYEQPTYLTPGTGIWLGVPHDASVDFIGAAVTDQNVTALTPGFNIISNPLVVSVPKDSLKLRKDGNTIAYAQAISNGWIAAGIQGYNKEMNNYQSADTLQIFQGYWIPVIQSDVEMVVTPPGYNQLPALAKKTDRHFAQNQDMEDWIVNISTSTTASTDPSLKFGIKPNGTDGYDSQYDEPKAPAPPTGKYVESFFSHPDWLPILGSKYNSDIRSPQTTQPWVFYVKSSENTAVTLTWDAASVPVQLEMTDNLNGNVVNLNASNKYTFDSNGQRSFTVNTIKTSVNEKTTLPTSYELKQNYPNPFNPATNIYYQLPVAGYVTLRLFDILGQEVQTLVDGEHQAGYYIVQFDGSRLSSGTYFYQIQAGSYISIKKMQLVK